MRRWQGVVGLVGAVLVCSCAGPSLDVPEREAATAEVNFEPEIVGGSVAPLFRAHLRGLPASGVPWLFRGELSEHYARALQRAEIANALRERAVPLGFWREGEGLAVQPSVWLEGGTNYSLAVAGVGVVGTFQVQEQDERRAQRLFPLPSAPLQRLAVVCGLGAEPLPSSLLLEPGGVALQVTPGVAGQPREGCATLQVEGSLVEPVVAPPRLAGALLEPQPWLPLLAAGAGDQPEPPCPRGEPLAGACLQVQDDRLRVTPVARDLLLVLEEPERLVLPARAGSRISLLRGLPPQGEVTLVGRWLSSEGEQVSFRRSITTTAAQRHLVLNEVLANPLGPEPDAEWLELVNDAEHAASLSGVWLEDSGGAVPLPDVVLAPGELALVVAEDFRASGLDVPVPANVRLLRVPSLGARGLANGGEALLLVGREGVLSRFPLLPATHAGRSQARRYLDGADDDPTGFGEHAGEGASPGAPNVLAE